MMDIYTRLLIMDIMISAVAIMVNILENCPINGKIHNISRILIISSIAADIILLLGIVNTVSCILILNKIQNESLSMLNILRETLLSGFRSL